MCAKIDPDTYGCLVWVPGPASAGGPSGSPTLPGAPETAANLQNFKCIPGALKVPQPLKTDPVWEGHTTGAIYNCTSIGEGQTVAPGMLAIWLANPPAIPDAQALARTAISQMNLHAITIGIVPEPRPGSVGIVGLPTWMWVDNPTENTIGPITRSAGAGAYTVTATATMKRIVWVMGDGNVVTCANTGTNYQESYGKSPSPTCGHRYTKQGAYTVSATTHWDVTWTGIGQTGTIPLTFTQSVGITMGEIQVITTR